MIGGRGQWTRVGTPIPLVRKKLTTHPPAVENFSLFVNYLLLFVNQQFIFVNCQLLFVNQQSRIVIRQIPLDHLLHTTRFCLPAVKRRPENSKF